MISNPPPAPLADGLRAASELQRLAAVHRYGILDTPPDHSLDRVTALAARLFSAPMSMVSIVDADRIWFKSRHGLALQQVERDDGLCASAIMQPDPWLLTDAVRDPRAMANPLVAGQAGWRFYLGIPLRTGEGFNLGTLCVVDHEPRSVSQAQIADLTDLASVVVDQMELRQAARASVAELSRALEEKEAALQQAGLLARETDHRIMNSLQIISSLLTLHGRELRGSEAGDALEVAAGRVRAIARVHRHLHLSDTAINLDCADYLQRLCADLSSMVDQGGRIAIEVDAAECSLQVERIVSLGLIINELIINAVKSGATRIRVVFGHAEAGVCRLSVSDNGPGLPAGFDPDRSQGLGMKVIQALARQLQGRLDIGPAGARGACFALAFSECAGAGV